VFTSKAASWNQTWQGERERFTDPSSLLGRDKSFKSSKHRAFLPDLKSFKISQPRAALLPASDGRSDKGKRLCSFYLCPPSKPKILSYHLTLQNHHHCTSPILWFSVLTFITSIQCALSHEFQSRQHGSCHAD
jgi:hypothetical protein